MTGPWPLPALWAWVCAWAMAWVLAWLGFPTALAVGAGATVGVLASLQGHTTRTRRLIMALGFPLSWALLSGVGAVPAWLWLLPAVLFLLLYPPGTWRDAPLFPTPPGALDGLRETVPLPLGGRVLDAGCGVGDGLCALERTYPDTRLYGLERSWPLRWVCAWRCRWATVRQGDIWAHDWSPYDMVYLFQRPESMPRAHAKAVQQMRPGTWLASLEFEVPGVPATVEWTASDGRPVWLYRLG